MRDEVDELSLAYFEIFRNKIINKIQSPLCDDKNKKDDKIQFSNYYNTLNEIVETEINNINDE